MAEDPGAWPWTGASQAVAVSADRLARVHGNAPARASLAAMLARVDQHSPAQGAELRAWAAQAGTSVEQLLTLDGGLLGALLEASIEGSLGLYVDGPAGPILAGAWDLEPEHAAQVELRPLADGGWLFGPPGPLGLAGVAARGFAVIANHLRPAALGPGLPGAVLLRSLLDAPSIDHARARIEATPLADGRNWMLADGRTFLGIEQLGGERILTRVGPKTGHVHANHCFDPALRQREAVPRSPASFRRLDYASTLYVQRRPATAAAVLAFLDEVEAAAFVEPRQRAQTVLAIELDAGVAHWRRHADERIQTTRL